MRNYAKHRTPGQRKGRKPLPAENEGRVAEVVNVAGQYTAALQEAGIPVATKTYTHSGNRNEHAFVDVDTDETYPLMWGWEIDSSPEDWLDALDLVDEEWAWMDYVAGIFDEIINEASESGRKRVKLLKIDCEGSEFPILFTSQTLHLIDDIRGEFHEYGGDHDPHSIPENARVEGFDRFTIEELTKVLEREGFTVTSERSGDTNLGLFFATRNR